MAANYLDKRTIYGYRIDIQTDKQTVDAHREEWRCSCVGSFRYVVETRKKVAERQKLQAAFYNQLPLATKAQKTEAAEKTRALVEPLVERYAAVMGVRPSAISFKPMKSRWGVCNVKDHSIRFSTYLLLLPDWCVEHVVVHELCHLLEPSHNARFHALMDKYFPKWKEARRETRKRIKDESDKEEV